MKTDKKTQIEYDYNKYIEKYNQLKNDLNSNDYRNKEYLTKDRIEEWIKKGIFRRKLKFRKSNEFFYITTASIKRGNSYSYDFEFNGDYIFSYWDQRGRKLMEFEFGEESPANGSLDFIGEYTPYGSNLKDIKYSSIFGGKENPIKDAQLFLEGKEEYEELEKIDISNFFRLKFETAEQGIQSKALYNEDSLIIDGSAGTGKSTIAIQKLKLFYENENINEEKLLLIVKNNQLKSHFFDLLKDKDINLSNISICLFSERFKDLSYSKINELIKFSDYIKNDINEFIEDRFNVDILNEHYFYLFNHIGLNFFKNTISLMLEKKKDKINLNQLSLLKESIQELERKMNLTNLSNEEKLKYKNQLSSNKNRLNELEGKKLERLLKNLSNKTIIPLATLNEIIYLKEIDDILKSQLNVLIWIFRYREFLRTKENNEKDKIFFESQLLKNNLTEKEIKEYSERLDKVFEKEKEKFKDNEQRFVNKYRETMNRVYFSKSYLTKVYDLNEIQRDYIFKILDLDDKEYNTIIVDEAQDFSIEELEIIRLNSERVILTGDILQNINKDKGLSNWDSLINRDFYKTIYKLKHNFRQTCQLASASYNYRQLLINENIEDISSDYFESEKKFNGRNYSRPKVQFIEKEIEWMDFVSNKFKYIDLNFDSRFPIVIIYKNEKEKFFYKKVLKDYKISLDRKDNQYDLNLLKLEEVKGNEFISVLVNINSFSEEELYLIMTRARFELDLVVTQKSIYNSILTEMLNSSLGKSFFDTCNISNSFFIKQKKENNFKEEFDVSKTRNRIIDLIKNRNKLIFTTEKYYKLSSYSKKEIFKFVVKKSFDNVFIKLNKQSIEYKIIQLLNSHSSIIIDYNFSKENISIESFYNLLKYMVDLEKEEVFAKNKLKDIYHEIYKNYNSLNEILDELKIIVNKKGLSFEENKEEVTLKIDNKDIETSNLKDNIRMHSSSIEHKKEELILSFLTNEELYKEKFEETIKTSFRDYSENEKNHIVEKVYIKKISKSDDEIKGQIKTYLSEIYKGYCQICGFTFRKNDGGNSFQVFRWTDKRIVKKEKPFTSTAESLCLCRNCSANIKWGAFEPLFLRRIESIKSFDKAIISEIKKVINILVDKDVPKIFRDEVDFDNMFALEIKLNNENKNIYLSDEHLTQFITYLQIEKTL